MQCTRCKGTSFEEGESGEPVCVHCGAELVMGSQERSEFDVGIMGRSLNQGQRKSLARASQRGLEQTGSLGGSGMKLHGSSSVSAEISKRSGFVGEVAARGIKRKRVKGVHQHGSTKPLARPSASLPDVSTQDIVAAFQWCLENMLRRLQACNIIDKLVVRKGREIWFIYLEALCNRGVPLDGLLKAVVTKTEEGKARNFNKLNAGLAESSKSGIPSSEWEAQGMGKSRQDFAKMRLASWKNLPPLTIELCVAIVYAATRCLKLGLFGSDFVRWALNGTLPYLQLYDHMPVDMRNILRAHRSIFRPSMPTDGFSGRNARHYAKMKEIIHLFLKKAGYTPWERSWSRLLEMLGIATCKELKIRLPRINIGLMIHRCAFSLSIPKDIADRAVECFSELQRGAAEIAKTLPTLHAKITEVLHHADACMIGAVLIAAVEVHDTWDEWIQMHFPQNDEEAFMLEFAKMRRGPPLSQSDKLIPRHLDRSIPSRIAAVQSLPRSSLRQYIAYVARNIFVGAVEDRYLSGLSRSSAEVFQQRSSLNSHAKVMRTLEAKMRQTRLASSTAEKDDAPERTSKLQKEVRGLWARRRLESRWYIARSKIRAHTLLVEQVARFIDCDPCRLQHNVTMESSAGQGAKVRKGLANELADYFQMRFKSSGDDLGI